MHRVPAFPALSLAAGLWVLIDVLRVWTPSLITLVGRAAETPPEFIGAFALACAAGAWLLVLATRAAMPGAWLALAVLLGCRAGLAFLPGGALQCWLASAGMLAGFWWLAVLAGRHARAVVPGVAAGLALATLTHAALGTFGAVWRNDGWGWLETGMSLLLAVLAVYPRRGPAAVERPGWRLAWMLFPALFLAGVLFSNAGRASAVGGAAGLLAVCGAAVLALAVAWAPATRGSARLAGGVLVVATALLACSETRGGPLTGLTPAWALAAWLPGAPALLHVLAAAGTRQGSAGPASVAAGGVLWVVLLFAYYAGYDLGYRADGLLVLVAALLAAGAWWPAPRPAAIRPFTVRALGLALVLAGVLAWAGPTTTLRPLPATPHTGPGVRVAAWNLRMGYGLDGRFDARAVARLLAGEGVDIVLLSEIDRGWLLNGGQDQLAIMARLLGMHAAFGPAADSVWGDAILSRTPLAAVHNRPYPRHGAVTGAEALVATTRVRGQTLTLLSTHLQPGAGGNDDTVQQAGELAALLAAQTGPTIGGGDLNTTPGSTAWQAIAASGFNDALAGRRPLPTSPADAPVDQIDHLWLAPGLRATRVRAPHVPLSDHLPLLLDVAADPAAHGDTP